MLAERDAEFNSSPQHSTDSRNAVRLRPLRIAGERWGRSRRGGRRRDNLWVSQNAWVSQNPAGDGAASESARWALGAAGVLTALLFGCYAAIHLAAVQHADFSVLAGFGHLGRHPRVSSIATAVAGLCDPEPFVYLCAIPVVVAILRGRVWLTLAIVAILLGASVTTELLKPLLDVHRAYALPGAPSSGSWPSGHATAAMSLALCCILAAPSRFRPALAVIGAAFAVGVSYSFLTLEWHYPTDVLGGFLVAGIWALLGMAAVWTAYGHRPADARSRARRVGMTRSQAFGPIVLVILALVMLVVLLLVAQSHDVVAFARVHKAFVAGAGAIWALALALTTGVTIIALRR